MYIHKCAVSMIEQSIKPEKWIVVDDSSDSKSYDIMKKFAEQNSWIELVKGTKKGNRGRGKRIAELVNFGLARAPKDWDFLSKIDADIILPKNYFEMIFSKFDDDVELGIASGGCYVPSFFGAKLEKVSPGHTRGALKTYRSSCYSEIGGIRNVDGWDGIDNLQAEIKGWKTENFPQIKSQHLRRTGSAHGMIRGSYETGRIAYFMGYHPLFMLARSMHRCISHPYLVGGFCMFAGYITNLVKNEPRFNDKEVTDYLRKKQLRRLGLDWKR